jgi:chorismate dehydratase
MDRQAKLRLGAVTYLNTKPLVYQLDQLLPEGSVQFDLPSRLADQLAAGRLDVALVPIVELFEHSEWQIVSDACIASRGPVLSVKLVFRTPPEQVRRVALDEGSRTSAALTRILLDRQLGIHPRWEPLPIGHDPQATNADAVLVIGDRAIGWNDPRACTTWDLGEVWWRWTGLPFVFAAWVAHPRIDARRVGQILSAARDQGVAAIEQIARTYTGYRDLTYLQCRSYLAEHLHFYLGPAEWAGLERFYQLGADGGLVTSRWSMPADERAVIEKG